MKGFYVYGNIAEVVGQNKDAGMLSLIHILAKKTTARTSRVIITTRNPATNPLFPLEAVSYTHL